MDESAKELLKEEYFKILDKQDRRLRPDLEKTVPQAKNPKEIEKRRKFIERQIKTHTASAFQGKPQELLDKKTGLYSKEIFPILLQNQMKRAERKGEILELLYIDLDGFKWINDTHGHPEGDRLIETISRLLKKVFRQSDIIGRMGGDEFCVGLVIETSKNVNKGYDRFVSEFVVLQQSIPHLGEISLSVGSQIFNSNNRDLTATDLIDQAEIAMTNAKQISGNANVQFQKDMLRQQKTLKGR